MLSTNTTKQSLKIKQLICKSLIVHDKICKAHRAWRNISYIFLLHLVEKLKGLPSYIHHFTLYNSIWSSAKYRNVFFQPNILSKMCLGGGYMYFVALKQAKHILPGNYALAPPEIIQKYNLCFFNSNLIEGSFCWIDKGIKNGT